MTVLPCCNAAGSRLVLTYHGDDRLRRGRFRGHSCESRSPVGLVKQPGTTNKCGFSRIRARRLATTKRVSCWPALGPWGGSPASETGSGSTVVLAGGATSKRTGLLQPGRVG